MLQLLIIFCLYNPIWAKDLSHSNQLQQEISKVYRHLTSLPEPQRSLIQSLAKDLTPLIRSLLKEHRWRKSRAIFRNYLLNSPYILKLNNHALNQNEKNWNLIYKAFLKSLPEPKKKIHQADRDQKSQIPKALNQYLCLTCHSLKKDEILAGPSFYNMGKKFNKEQIKLEILKPDLIITKGFSKGIMSGTLKAIQFESRVSQEELDSIINFLSTL